MYVSKQARNVVLLVVPGSPISTPASTEPIALIFEPANHFLYASLTPGNAIAAYSFNSTSGALTTVAGSPFATGHGPFGMATDPQGKFLYVANHFDDTVSVLSIGGN